MYLSSKLLKWKIVIFNFFMMIVLVSFHIYHLLIYKFKILFAYYPNYSQLNTTNCHFFGNDVNALGMIVCTCV